MLALSILNSIYYCLGKNHDPTHNKFLKQEKEKSFVRQTFLYQTAAQKTKPNSPCIWKITHWSDIYIIIKLRVPEKLLESYIPYVISLSCDNWRKSPTLMINDLSTPFLSIYKWSWN